MRSKRERMSEIEVGKETNRERVRVKKRPRERESDRQKLIMNIVTEKER